MNESFLFLYISHASSATTYNQSPKLNMETSTNRTWANKLFLQHKIKNQLISNKSNLAVKYGKILRERKVINLEYTCITNGEEKKNNEVFTYFIRPSIWVHSFCVGFLFYPIQILFDKQSKPNIHSTFSTVSYINTCITENVHYILQFKLWQSIDYSSSCKRQTSCRPSRKKAINSWASCWANPLNWLAFCPTKL